MEIEDFLSINSSVLLIIGLPFFHAALLQLLGRLGKVIFYFCTFCASVSATLLIEEGNSLSFRKGLLYHLY